ncbi:MAG: DUF4358 domain-containing protein [Ruminococcus sp.]|nr:DUF4358 domain-containing protein [Ruminococcus sp.]
MKKILSAVLAAALAGTLLCSCGKGGSDKAAAELLGAAKNSGAAFEELVSVEGSDIKYTYDIEESLYEDFAAEAAGNMAFADEIVFIKASSEDNIEKIKKALEARVQSRKDTLQSYAPAEYDKLCKSEIIVNGNYVYLIVGGDIKTAQKAVDKMF